MKSTGDMALSYGIRQRGLPLCNWHERFLDWMTQQNVHHEQ